MNVNKDPGDNVETFEITQIKGVKITRNSHIEYSNFIFYCFHNSYWLVLTLVECA